MGLEELGKELKKIRQEKGITVQDICFFTGLRSQYIYDLEKGRRNITWNNLMKISNFLDVEIKML